MKQTSHTVILEKGRRQKDYFKDLWRYRELLLLFVKRDFTAKYKQTIIGPLWHFIQPILTTAVSCIVFNLVAGISTNGVNPVLFQMSGIIIWNYFANCLVSTSGTFVNNAGIFGKVYFPRLISPISLVISQLIQFGIQLMMLITIMTFFYFRGEGFPINIHWLLVPPVLIIMAGIGLGLGIVITSVTTKYRDFAVLIGFGVQLLMYASAVNYPISALQKISAKYPFIYGIIRYNPLATIVEIFRNAMLDLPVNTGGLWYSAIWMIVLCIVGSFLFSRVEKTFMDTV